jgi:uncharacterized coiled-coil protein SlyX
MTTRTDLDAANTKLAEDLAALDTLNATIASDQANIDRLTQELNALPVELAGKTDQELAYIGHAILSYFGGVIPA